MVTPVTATARAATGQVHGNVGEFSFVGHHASKSPHNLSPTADFLFSPTNPLEKLPGFTLEGKLPKIPDFERPIGAKLTQIAAGGFQALAGKFLELVRTPKLPVLVQGMLPALHGSGVLPAEWVRSLGTHFATKEGSNTQEGETTQAWRETLNTTMDGQDLQQKLDQYPALPKEITRDNYLEVISKIKELSMSLDRAIDRQLDPTIKQSLSQEKFRLDIEMAQKVDQILANHQIFKNPSALVNLGRPQYLELDSHDRHFYNYAMAQLEEVGGDPSKILSNKANDIQLIALDPATYFQAKNGDTAAQIFLGRAIRTLAIATQSPQASQLHYAARKEAETLSRRLASAEEELQELQDKVTQQDAFLSSRKIDTSVETGNQIQTLNHLTNQLDKKTLEVQTIKIQHGAAKYVVRVLENLNGMLPLKRLDLR